MQKHRSQVLEPPGIAWRDRGGTGQVIPVFLAGHLSGAQREGSACLSCRVPVKPDAQCVGEVEDGSKVRACPSCAPRIKASAGDMMPPLDAVLQVLDGAAERAADHAPDLYAAVAAAAPWHRDTEDCLACRVIDTAVRTVAEYLATTQYGVGEPGLPAIVDPRAAHAWLRVWQEENPDKRELREVLAATADGLRGLAGAGTAVPRG